MRPHAWACLNDVGGRGRGAMANASSAASRQLGRLTPAWPPHASSAASRQLGRLRRGAARGISDGDGGHAAGQLVHALRERALRGAGPV